MFDPQLLKMLRCPKTGSPLQEAEPSLISELNAKIISGELSNLGGIKIEMPFDAALVNQDRSILFPVKGRIVALVYDRAIGL